jgi:hypothetical protein
MFMHRLTISSIAAAGALLLAAPRVDAQSVTVRRVTTPPQVEDFASAEHSPAVDGLTPIDRLVQRSPVDGAPITEPTDVYLGFDAQNLYAIFVCWYSPGTLRAHRVNRDRLPDDDDSVALHLDTFHDRRHLYGFQVNPAGVQVDGVFTEGQGWDLSFDTVWDAHTLIRPDRFVVMITVPFSSIRFPEAAEQDWGFFVYRGMPRKDEEAFWPAYSTRYLGRLAYAAQLRGLERIDAGHSTQIVPYGTVRGAHQGARDNASAELVDTRGGIDVKTIMRSGLVLDLTANPDFSQVESDEPQTTVNKRFEVYFPEKRPFFLENASYFDTPIQALFTRRIRDPTLGARLSGKVGPYAIGALVTDDAPPTDVAATSPDESSRAVNSVFRVSRDLAADSHVGLLYSGHRDSVVNNQVGGVDGRWRLTPNWVASAQVLTSSTREANAPSTAGTASRVAVNASGHTYGYAFAYTDISPDFRAASGFIPRTDFRDVSQTISATVRPANKWVTSWGPIATVSRVWDHAGTVLDDTVRIENHVESARSSHFSIFLSQNPERLRIQDAPLLKAATLFQQHTTGVTFGSAPRSRFAFSGEYSAGPAINLSPAQGTVPSLGDSRAMNITVSIRPAASFTVDTTYLWSTLSDPIRRTTAFNDRILRSRSNYQITRRLSARAIAQYDELGVDRASSSLIARRSLNVDLLVTYLVHPGTALYVGWNRDRQRLTDERTEQLFVKVSYLIRP